MRSRTLYRHPVLRTLIYPPILLLCLYVAHFTVDLITPFETTAADHELAAEYLATHQLPTPPEPFHRDGCTLWPDKLFGHDFTTPCLHHDIAYWAGGSVEHKEYVNESFRAAVAQTGPLGPVFGFVMYYGVTWFGDNGVSRAIDSHWGFGWD